MTLPYAALGVRPGARDCTVPAGLERRGVVLLKGLRRQLQHGTAGEPAYIQYPDGLPADGRETERLPLRWMECVFRKGRGKEGTRCNTMVFEYLQPQSLVSHSSDCLKVGCVILIQYTVFQIQHISPHVPLAVRSVCALKKKSGVAKHWL